MRRAARTDANQPAIVDALLATGCAVQSLAALGCGVPDLLVARGNRMWLIECKDGDKPPSERQLTPDQKKWHARWPVRVHVVNDVGEALAVVTEQAA